MLVAGVVLVDAAPIGVAAADVRVTDLPAFPVNATLNALATMLLRGRVGLHRARPGHRAPRVHGRRAGDVCRVPTSYVIYHYHAGSRPFTGTGADPPVYFTILITHVVLAAAIVPLVLMTVARALRGQFARHRAIARWTLPLWLYVSVTGVVVYWMLYRM